MLITPELANEIVTRAMAIIHHNVNVIDHRGVIIASGERSRIGTQHTIAQQVIRTGKRISIHPSSEAANYENVQPGINHPIMADDQVVMVIGVSGDPPAINRYAELAILTAELLVRQALEIRDVNWQQRLRDTLFVQYIQDGDTPSGQDALQRLSGLGFHLDRPLVPIVVRISRHHHTNVLAGLLGDLSRLTNIHDVIILGSHEILLLGSMKTDTTRQIDSVKFSLSSHLSHYHIGVGVKAESACGIREAIQLARAVIEVGQQVQPQQQIYHFRDMAMFCLLSVLKNSYMYNFFNNNVNRILKHDQGSILLDTLEVFILNNGEPGKAARQLGVHRNTLTYRLNQIKKKLQLDPFSFADLVQLSVSVHCYRHSHPRPNDWMDSVV